MTLAASGIGGPRDLARVPSKAPLVATLVASRREPELLWQAWWLDEELSIVICGIVPLHGCGSR